MLYTSQFKNWGFDQEALKFFGCNELQCYRHGARSRQKTLGLADAVQN